MKKFLLTFLVLVFGSGLAFSQEQWTLLNTSNSDIPSDKTISLGITANDVIYIGTPGGLVDPSHVYEYANNNWIEMDWFSEFKNMKSSPLGYLTIATSEGDFITMVQPIPCLMKTIQTLHPVISPVLMWVPTELNTLG